MLIVPFIGCVFAGISPLLRHFGGHGTAAATADFLVTALGNAVGAVLAGELKGAIGASTTRLAVATDLRFQIGLDRSNVVQSLAAPTGNIDSVIGAVPLRREFRRPGALLAIESACALDRSDFGRLDCSLVRRGKGYGTG